MRNKTIFKTHLIFIFLFVIGSGCLFAQTDMIDVVTLKSGEVYKGYILEQVPNENLRMRTLDGEILQVQMSDVEIIKKENMSTADQKKVKSKTAFEKTYFVQIEPEIFGPLAFHFAGGYRFHRFGYLGIGTGFDNYLGDIFSGTGFWGTVFPFYVRYGGDVLNSKVTPRYDLSVGYAYNPEKSPLLTYNEDENDYYQIEHISGFYSELDVGFRINGGRKFNFGVALSIKYHTARVDEIIKTPIYDTNTNTTIIREDVVSSKLDLPRFGLKFKLGLN